MTSLNNEVQAVDSASCTFQELFGSFINETVVPLTARELEVHRPLPVLHTRLLLLHSALPKFTRVHPLCPRLSTVSILVSAVSPHPCPSWGPPPSPLLRG